MTAGDSTARDGDYTRKVREELRVRCLHLLTKESFLGIPSEHEREFVELVADMEEVQECHFVTGDFSCLVKAKVADRGELRELILDRINRLGGVRQTKTWIVLETAKETPRLRIPEPDDGRSEA